MFFITLGLLIGAISLFISKSTFASTIPVKPMRITAYLFIFIGLLSACVVQINAGELGIKSLFGSVQKDVLKSGLHLVNPLMTITKTDSRTQNYTMSAVHSEGNKQGDDAIRVLSADGLEVVIDLTVLYKIIPSEAPRVLRETGMDYEDKIVRPIARTKIRDNAVYFDAVSLYSTKRDQFQNKIFADIQAEFSKRGLFLENLLVRNITLPALVKTAIEQKIEAEQEAQKMEFVLQKEKQEADRKRVEAQGISDYQKIITTTLTDKQLQYEQIKAMKDLASSTNAKIIMMGKGSAPILLDGK